MRQHKLCFYFYKTFLENNSIWRFKGSCFAKFNWEQNLIFWLILVTDIWEALRVASKLISCFLKQKCSCFRLINIWFSFIFVPYHFLSTFPPFCSMNLKILLHMVLLLHFTHPIPLLILVSSSGLTFSTAESNLSCNDGDAPVALICNPLQGLFNSCLGGWDISKLVETLCPQTGNTGEFGRERDKCTPEELRKSWRSFLMLEHHFPAWSFLQVLKVCCWVGWMPRQPMAHPPGSCPHPSGLKAQCVGHGWRTCGTKSQSASEMLE